jgi:beta-ureidopropionase / N-carbamoyl-L-amino-acid hydrolase
MTTQLNMTHTLAQLNAAPLAEAAHMLDGIYEHSPWIAEQALVHRPFKSLSNLKHHLQQTLVQAGENAQKTLIRAHPELAGKAMVAQTLTASSTDEQSRAGLTHCTEAEFLTIQALNAEYNAKFGWPFILAVRGARGCGLEPRANHRHV